MNTLSTTTFAVIILLLLFGSCSNDDMPEPSCFQEENRKVVTTFTDVNGKIVGPREDLCPSIYLLTGGPQHPQRLVPHLFPCNLPDSLKKGGQKVQFSGYLFETFESEDVCAQKFEITEIKVIDEYTEQVLTSRTWL